MRREETPVPPILAAADEEGLDAHLARLAGKRENVPVAQPLGMNRLAALHIGQGAKTVAIDRGKLEILFRSGLRHQPPQPCLDAGGLAGEKQLRIGYELAILLLADPTHARGRTTLDLIEQAGPRTV